MFQFCWGWKNVEQKMLWRARELDTSFSTTHQGVSSTASNSSSGNLVTSLLSRYLHSYMIYIHIDLHPTHTQEEMFGKFILLGKELIATCFLGQNFWCEQDPSLFKVFCLVLRPFRFEILTIQMIVAKHPPPPSLMLMSKSYIYMVFYKTEPHKT